MIGEAPEETYVEQEVTYVIEHGGRVIIIEHVPARVRVDTGERFFAPEIVERLQDIVWEHKVPTRMVETPVFDFAQGR